ncbi:MAG: lamin tail domain-containing protein, partial [Thermoplasmata archaeon]|nr:lamin tail domain-containing protein [Thermoplasmata archaeon]
GSESRLYVDGNLDRDNIAETTTIADTDLASIAQEYDFGPVTSEFFEGAFDEVRISRNVRSDKWIETEFNNQNDTSSFYSVFEEEILGYQWVELYNPENSAIDLTSWNLTDNDGNYFSLSGAGSIPASGYLICHLGQSGTNSSTDVYGPPGNMLETIDDLTLLDNNGSIIDYVAWGGDAGIDDTAAAAAGEWTDGAYVDTSELLVNETIGRNKESTDTNSPADWEHPSSTRADPFGVNATNQTAGAQNLDCIIPEFDILAVPIAILTLITICINRFYNSNPNQNSNKKKRRTKKKRS